MLPAPPKRPRPDEFYIEHLPAFWQAFLDGTDLPPIRFSIQVLLAHGSDELRYVVSVAGGSVSARSGTVEAPELTIALDTDAYRTATRDLWPRAARRLSETLARARRHLSQAFAGADTDAWIASLLELPGELELRHTDDAGDVTVTRLTIGSGPGARACIVSSDADASLLLEGRSSLVQLLKSRATIEGDSGWVLRLATRLQPA